MGPHLLPASACRAARPLLQQPNRSRSRASSRPASHRLRRWTVTLRAIAMSMPLSQDASCAMARFAHIANTRPPGFDAVALLDDWTKGDALPEATFQGRWASAGSRWGVRAGPGVHGVRYSSRTSEARHNANAILAAHGYSAQALKTFSPWTSRLSKIGKRARARQGVRAAVSLTESALACPCLVFLRSVDCLGRSPELPPGFFRRARRTGAMLVGHLHRETAARHPDGSSSGVVAAAAVLFS
ncbi:hypothetical protein T492DRAFT_275519 [Pavlovales sp. CCMP2436]|nr:hypothetical protein T492DRAFT_275519 [Pavlovales sp. CCMP2436]